MPDYIHEKLATYMDDAASGSATPGGGSVSALAGALATTMASMAANFTTGKKKFSEVQNEIDSLLDELSAERAKLLAEMQRDTEAYSSVSTAYAMPRSTDDEEAARRASIQEALSVAMGPPLETLGAIARSSRANRRLADIANPNLITDVGVAALLLGAAAEGAALNVDINLSGLKDKAKVAEVAAEVKDAREEVARLSSETMTLVRKAMG